MRKFKCIGLEESNVSWWSQWFTIGEVYEYIRTINEGNLKMIGDDGDVYWNVDADQFEEVKEANDE